ncbi:MAG: hypothetical protein ACR2L2_11230 [Acidobacteriota bacterium]
MALDPKRRQKQLAKKAARRAKKRASRPHSSGSKNVGVNPMEMAKAISAPIYESLMPQRLFELGLGNLVVSRRTADRVAVGVFLVDVFCLGVKDAFFNVISLEKYQTLLASMSREGPYVPLHPTCARKLVEKAVEYARSLRLDPHKGYRLAKVIFGDLDGNVCPTSFEFGKDGKPLFISGPNDTPKRCRQILDALSKHCGQDGYHYVMTPDQMI